MTSWYYVCYKQIKHLVDCEIDCENTEALTILECEYTDDRC